ncbi:hypothetical protein [Mycolicibacterium fortuitum]|uniref:hypothetical protein n=1 Tax=Mycolicibacterium fortuitum TaxID=1766 RepID=UPI000AF40DA9|nr:hypothetical protein [Mycolicibacterium fortuitum]
MANQSSGGRPNTPLGGWSLPWRDDFAQVNMRQASEFGTPTGHVDPDQYRGTIASLTLEHALPEGNPNDPEVGSAEWLDSVNQLLKSTQPEGNPNG